MSALTVIIVIGTVLLLTAIGDNIGSKGSNTGLMNVGLRISLGILGLLLLIYGGYSYGLVNPQAHIEQVSIGNKLQVNTPVQKVQIISPINDDLVNCRILTMGVYPDDNTKDIWVLLKPSDDKFYPQSDHTNTSFKRNGEWQVVTRFGGDKGEEFEIIVFETDANASQFFSRTIAKWKDALEFPGLSSEEIPAGAVEVDRISVSLEEDCRGVF